MGPVADAERKAAGGRLKEDDLMHALPARSANREVRVGIFVLIGIAAFLTILFTMTDVGTFRGRYYATTVVESAGGMRRGDPVQMRGVNIGRVIQFRMVPEGVAVRMEIYNEYRIPSDSHAELRSSGLLGGVTVDVVPGDSPERVASGAVIPGRTTVGIFEAAEDLGIRADTVLTRVSMLLSEQNVGAIGASAGELHVLIRELNAVATQLNAMATQQRTDLAGLSASLLRSAEGVEAVTAGPELQRSVQQIDALTAQLNQTTVNLNETSESLQTVIGRMERGEGTLGRLSNDDALYAEMQATVSNLNALVTDIQQNPRRYINISVF